MNIKNKYCLLSKLTKAQIDKLMELMPESVMFDFKIGETLVGFTRHGSAGTFREDMCDEIITYKEMLSLLGAKEEELVPHVHQKEIIAWANGEEIQVQGQGGGDWYPANPPEWLLNQQYRVKPKLTPTQLRIKEIVAELHELHKQDAVERGIDKVMGK
jgi:hypothetical protein